LVRLEVLQATCNELKSLPEALGDCSALTDLQVAGCLPLEKHNVVLCVYFQREESFALERKCITIFLRFLTFWSFLSFPTLRDGI
jgi:hypothetical protein